MRLYTADESRELDTWATQELGISTEALMENAGSQVVMAMEQEWGSLAGKAVSIFCGKGNNGGDGLVAARHLANQGCLVRIYFVDKPEALNPQAARQYAICHKMGLFSATLADEAHLQAAKKELAASDILVDAVLGTGSRGAVTGFLAKLFVFLNSLGRPCVCVDIPSGLDAASGKVEGACLYGHLTVTFACAKLGLLVYPGASFVGKLVVADIGIPFPARPSLNPQRFYLERRDLLACLPPRPAEANKRSVGTALLVVGSRQYTGAAILAARGALGSGAGMLRLAVPGAIASLLQSQVPEAIVHPMGGPEDAAFQEKDLDPVLDLVKNCQAALVGPGLGNQGSTSAFARGLWERIECPAVFDADALGALAQEAKPATRPRILTPHAGEMGRLTGLPPAQVDSDRVAVAQRCAKDRQAVALLKGPHSLVAEPSGALYVNSTGNPGMATGGSGDVLGGLLAGLLAQGLDASAAARLGVYLHGLAGDLVAGRQGERGMRAGDIAAMIPPAFQELEKTSAGS